MFNVSENPFSFVPQIAIPDDADIIFVSDMFVEEYVGGAELTTQALIDAPQNSQFNVFKLKSKDVTVELLQQGHKKFWIFGNWSTIDMNLIPTIVGNITYSILEYDYKYCKYRSPELHFKQESVPCDCHNQMHGKMVSAFYYGAAGLFWMSEKQMEKYHANFPFLAERDNIVLNSVFDATTLTKIKVLRENITQDEKGESWIVLKSPSWVKGAGIAKQYCEDNALSYEEIWGLSYDETLAKLASSKGFVYLPAGSDTCPRMVIEAKLLGCELKLNDYVQHKDEEWFATDDIQSIEDFLLTGPATFWKAIKEFVEYEPTISGYITTYNCIDQEYPFEKAIDSMLTFCDEVCVVDGGSTDATYNELLRMAAEYATQDPETNEPILKLRVSQVKRDWSHPRHAVFDGMQKAEARKMCTSEFCWQMDSDEIVHEDHVSKVKEFCRSVSKGVDIVCLPVVEYWGSADKVRIDATPWKWRLSRNKPYITHGIPTSHRVKDEHDELFALEGTDGCDMIHAETGEPIVHLNFWNNDMEQLRRSTLQGDPMALQKYQELLNAVVRDLPSVFHYSWFNLERKIRLYRDYWQNHWNALYNKSTEDTAENNNFFEVPWKDVTDEMITDKAKELSDGTGGWIFHSPWKGQRLPHIKIDMEQPNSMKKES